jgi:hypothetical protein
MTSVLSPDSTVPGAGEPPAEKSTVDAPVVSLPSTVDGAAQLRLLSIAADLLPLEITEAWRGRIVRRIVLIAVAAFAVLLGGWYATAHYQAAEVETGLVQAEDDVRRLAHQQKAFDELVRTQNESKVIGEQLTSLLAQDLQWSTLLSSLQKAAPAGVSVTGITGSLNPPGGADSTPELSKGSKEKLIGTLTVTGTGSGKQAVAQYADVLAGVPGVAQPLLTDAVEQDEKVMFTIRLDITESALGGRYTKTTEAGGK